MVSFLYSDRQAKVTHVEQPSHSYYDYGGEENIYDSVQVDEKIYDDIVQCTGVGCFNLLWIFCLVSKCVNIHLYLYFLLYFLKRQWKEEKIFQNLVNELNADVNLDKSTIIDMMLSN